MSAAAREAAQLALGLAEEQPDVPMEDEGDDEAAAAEAALLRQQQQQQQKASGGQLERKGYLGPPMEAYLRAQQKPKTWFRRDVANAKVKRPRSPSVNAVLAALIRARKITEAEAEAVLRTTPRTKGKYFQRIKGTPEFQQLQERALGTRLLEKDALVDELQALAGPERDNIKAENYRVKAIRDPKQRRNATRDLYGKAPLSHLLPGQRGYLSKKILEKRAVDPAVAVQLFARQDGGIASATRCAAAVEAARLASRGTYGSANAKYTQQAIINPQKAIRAKAGEMTEAQRSSIYRGLKKLDAKGLPKSGVPRTTTFIAKLRGLGVPADELQRIQSSQNVSPKKQYRRYAVPARAVAEPMTQAQIDAYVRAQSQALRQQLMAQGLQEGEGEGQLLPLL